MSEIGTLVVTALSAVAAASAAVAFVYALRTRVPRLRVTALVMALFPWIIASSAQRIIFGVESLLGRFS